jgi:hypothetical protein
MMVARMANYLSLELMERRSIHRASAAEPSTTTVLTA